MGLGPKQVALIAIWIDMLPSDGQRAAESAASIFEPFPYVAQFHDPNRLVGVSVARSIDAPVQTAWDMYLFYDRHSEWKKHAPEPLDWIHQLGQDDWADPARFHWGDALRIALRAKMESVLQKSHSA